MIGRYVSGQPGQPIRDGGEPFVRRPAGPHLARSVHAADSPRCGNQHLRRGKPCRHGASMNRKPAVDGPPVGSVNSLDWNEVMVDRNWTKRVTQAAASTARDRLLGTADRGATLAKGVGGAVGQAADGVRDLITNIERPRVPLLETWGIGLGQILSCRAGLAESLRGAVGRLDRFGRLEISSDAISFDGDEVRWEKVDEIKFGPA